MKIVKTLNFFLKDIWTENRNRLIFFCTAGYLGNNNITYYKQLEERTSPLLEKSYDLCKHRLCL